MEIINITTPIYATISHLNLKNNTIFSVKTFESDEDLKKYLISHYFKMHNGEYFLQVRDENSKFITFPAVNPTFLTSISIFSFICQMLKMLRPACERYNGTIGSQMFCAEF